MKKSVQQGPVIPPVPAEQPEKRADIPGDGKGTQLLQEEGATFEVTKVFGTRPDSGARIHGTMSK